MNLTEHRLRAGSPATRALGTALVLASVAACGSAGHQHGGGAGAAGDHGKVVAYLAIPYRVGPGWAGTGSAKTVNVLVHPGQRFAVKVATSDGPFAWRQISPAPDARVVRVVGDFNQGHCAKAAVGCRVPYFHVLRAEKTGSTTMTWLYRELACTSLRKKMTQATRSCTAVVTFTITVR